MELPACPIYLQLHHVSSIFLTLSTSFSLSISISHTHALAHSPPPALFSLSLSFTHTIIHIHNSGPSGYGIVRPKLMSAEWIAVAVVSALYFIGGKKNFPLPYFLILIGASSSRSTPAPEIFFVFPALFPCSRLTSQTMESVRSFLIHQHLHWTVPCSRHRPGVANSSGERHTRRLAGEVSVSFLHRD